MITPVPTPNLTLQINNRTPLIRIPVTSALYDTTRQLLHIRIPNHQESIIIPCHALPVAPTSLKKKVINAISSSLRYLKG